MHRGEGGVGRDPAFVVYPGERDLNVEALWYCSCRPSLVHQEFHLHVKEALIGRAGGGGEGGMVKGYYGWSSERLAYGNTQLV